MPKPIYQIKAYRAGFRTILKMLNWNEFLDFLRSLKTSDKITFRKLQVQAIIDI